MTSEAADVVITHPYYAECCISAKKDFARRRGGTLHICNKDWVLYAQIEEAAHSTITR